MSKLTAYDHESILLHFSGRLYQRYNIFKNARILQQDFKRLVSSGEAVKMWDYDKTKAAYVTRYEQAKVLFVWSHEHKMAKTALTL